MASFFDTDFDTEVLRGVISKSPLSTTHSAPPNRRGRLMHFTWFNVDNPIVFDDTMSYLCYALETCPTTGKKHLQGWVYFKNARWSAACRKKYGCYMQKCDGTIEQNDKYCSKQGTLTEFGDKPNQGARGDLEEIRDMIVDHQITVDELCVEQPIIFHQYGRTLERIQDIAMRKVYRNGVMTQCMWYYGPTGTGKSHTAFKDYDPSSTYIYPYDGGWWDAYKQQDTVVFNEFRGQIPMSELLTIIDKWPHMVRRRNREPMPFTSKKVIITSALQPKDIYYNLSKNDDLSQLLRRINLIKLDTKYNPCDT